MTLASPDRGPAGAWTAKTLLSWITGALFAVSVVLLMTSIIGMTWDVVLRKVQGRGLADMNAYTEVMQVMFVFCGLGAAYQRNALVTVTLATMRMRRPVAVLCRTFGNLLLLAIATMICVASWRVAVASTLKGEIRFGISHVLLWPARLALAIGISLFVIHIIFALFSGLRDIRRR
jgi:TRAP-type C4-dicarboxylate transport system permease small subunit